MSAAIEFLPFCSRSSSLLPRTHCGFLLLCVRQFLSPQPTASTLSHSLSSTLCSSLSLLPFTSSYSLLVSPFQCSPTPSPPNLQAQACTEISKEMRKDLPVILLCSVFQRFHFPKINTSLLYFAPLSLGLIWTEPARNFPLQIWTFLKNIYFTNYKFIKPTQIKNVDIL